MKKSLIVVLLVLLMGGSRISPAQCCCAGNDKVCTATLSTICCHRCGMFVPGEKAIRVHGVPVGPWPECCSACALFDILESSEKQSGTIEAYCDLTKMKVEVEVQNGKAIKVTPPSSVILFGGTCVTNKVFIKPETAKYFIAQQDWAKDKPVKTWPEMMEMLAKKTNRIDRCAICATLLKDREKTWFIVFTRDKARKLCCCSHCGLFLFSKEKDIIKNIATPDYDSMEYIDARKAFYVVGHKEVSCCVPATAAFRNKKDALKFQNKSGGTIYTLEEALANIDKVMKTSQK